MCRRRDTPPLVQMVTVGYIDVEWDCSGISRVNEQFDQRGSLTTTLQKA